MLTQVLTHDTVALRERPRQQAENRRGRSEDDTFNLRRLVAIRLERTVITRVPTLDWPSDLFADVRLEIAA
jgi:hypothetical protein